MAIWSFEAGAAVRDDQERKARVFRQRFELEVEYLWQRLRGLGERYPQLEALYTRNADPRVARLVQSAAFAFASVHARIQDDGQALVRPLVARAMPECLRPRPASTIMQLTRSHDSRARFFGRAGPVELPFVLRWPVQVASFDLKDVRIERVHAKLQVLRITMAGQPNVALGNCLPDALRVFVRVESCARALDLIHALRTSTSAIEVKGYDETDQRCLEATLPAGSLRWARLDSDEASLVSAPGDRFHSSTLLRDLYAFPESFCFFDLNVGGLRGGKVARLELTLPFARLVDDVLHLRDEHFLLGCAPATNEYVSPIEPLRDSKGMTRWSLKVAGRPHAEVLHVHELSRVSTHGAPRRDPVYSWESPAAPHRFGATDVYFLLEQSSAIGEPRTETYVSFASEDGFDRPLPGLSIDGEVLASDGAVTNALGLGDVGRGQGAVNVTRVAPSRRASVGANHAWRMNAYARMPPARFVTRSYLHEFFKLHDSSDAHDEQARIGVPRFTNADHVREHRLSEGMLEWGDVFTVELDAPNATEGEAWILSELLSRAIAERNERLRFSRLNVTRESAIFAEFAARRGARLPFPLG